MRGRSGVTLSQKDLLRLHHLTRDQPPEGRAAFRGVDVWRWQYFQDVACPPGVVIPINDPVAWPLYPRHRVVYNKLFICESQGIRHGPHGVAPDRFPVFSKPIVNLDGMGSGGRVLHSARELETHFASGHLWMDFLAGEHISTDVALARGTPCWWRHTIGYPLPGGMFNYWAVLTARRPALESYLSRWIGAHLRGFTGVVNIETIGGIIIECHLRMAEQWADLNGPGWLDAVVALYARGRWRYTDRRRGGYSVVLFGRHGRRYRIDPDAVEALRARPGISSIQITFDVSRPPERHSMPPGGFRLAIVNCWDLEAGRAVREQLRRRFRALPEEGGSAPA